MRSFKLIHVCKIFRKRANICAALLICSSVLTSVILMPSSIITPAKAEAPALPPGVPAKAIWVGGADGGIFLILQTINGKSREFHAHVWDYPSGTLEYNGILRPSGNAPKTIDIKDGQEFLGWDGVALYLRGGGSLRVSN